MYNDSRLNKVSELATRIRNGEVDNDTLYEFLLMGYKCFKSGMGLSIDLVRSVIEDDATNYDGVVGE